MKFVTKFFWAILCGVMLGYLAVQAGVDNVWFVLGAYGLASVQYAVGDIIDVLDGKK